jgi:hypothetical protein
VAHLLHKPCLLSGSLVEAYTGHDHHHSGIMTLGFGPSLICFTYRTHWGAVVMGKGRVSAKKSGPRRGIKRDQTNEPQSIPRELAGRWIAWSGDGLRIIGSGTSLKEAEAVASAAGDPNAIFERASGVLRQ